MQMVENVLKVKLFWCLRQVQREDRENTSPGRNLLLFPRQKADACCELLCLES